MKKILLLGLALCFSLSSWADEGMWLLPYLQKMNIKNMKERGCKLTAEDIYSLNHAALKDAIVIFGGGCTGEVVSSEGLVFTNHHCGFSSIQSLSSVEHDYLKNGFWARSNQEEIPAPGLEVRFIRKIIEVTDQVLKDTEGLSLDKRRDKASANFQVLMKKLEKENPGMDVIIPKFFGGNQYFAFVMEVFSDVRLVGTPPQSIGKFGGETDNWMWPRHTGDFSVFRIYADKDNHAAAYSAENRPYRPVKHLDISLDGYREGDFAMIMGFPGTTQRYMTSYEIDRLVNVENPIRIFARGERQEILARDMAASDRVRIQYAAKYAGSANYWKNSIGKSRDIKRLHIKEVKEAQEAAFQAWADKNTKPEEGYIEALPMIKKSIANTAEEYASIQYLVETIWYPVEIVKIARTAASAIDSATFAAHHDELKAEFEEFYKDFNEPTERRVAHRMFQIAKEKCKLLPSIFTDVIDQKFGGSTDAYVDYLYDNSLFASQEKAMKFLENPSKSVYEADPAVVLLNSGLSHISKLQQAMRADNADYATGHRLYIDGLMKMNPNKAWASYANSTIRLTFGRVLPYTPADGIRYNYYTTLKGVMEKEDANNPEFYVPQRLKDLYASKDFGRYADKAGELPVCFLADCDITGGNSGSPVMNAKGQLIGLAFDGNWEALSGDVAFEPNVQRTIAVDIRYVLFIIDKYAGAGWLLNELTLK